MRVTGEDLDSELETPILFLVFNRPEVTKKVFDRIREAKPKYLYVAADGPRETHPDDVAKCAKVRGTINEVDWDCKVNTLFREKNLGCGKAVSQAISWFFDHVEEGIILEDDILPSLNFFQFCEEMLHHYRYETKVMHISGLNFQKKKWGAYAYYFSSYAASIWGWATWRDRWGKYVLKMDGVDAFLESDTFVEVLPLEPVRKHYSKALQATATGQLNTWDYPWLYTFWKHKGLSIAPNFNMVNNIGFDAKDATHTVSRPSFLKLFHEKPQVSIKNHPNLIERNLDADLDRMKVKYLTKPPILKRINLSKLITLKNIFL